MKTCVWNDSKQRYVLKEMIVGHFAMWAIRQSPSDQPGDLSRGVAQFLDNLPVEDGREYTCASLRKQVEVAIKESPVTISWNETPPGVDFIDLDALARNIAHSVWLEILYNDEVAVIHLPDEPTP